MWLEAAKGAVCECYFAMACSTASAKKVTSSRHLKQSRSKPHRKLRRKKQCMDPVFHSALSLTHHGVHRLITATLPALWVWSHLSLYSIWRNACRFLKSAVVVRRYMEDNTGKRNRWTDTSTLQTPILVDSIKIPPTPPSHRHEAPPGWLPTPTLPTDILTATSGWRHHGSALGQCTSLTGSVGDQMGLQENLAKLLHIWTQDILKVPQYRFSKTN